MEKLKIAIINSTVREHSIGIKVANWVLEHAKEYSDNEFELVELKDYPMSFNIFGKDDYAKSYNEKLNSFDGYIIVTGEYNHSIPGVLKNALDWTSMTSMANRPAGIISYGAVGGARSAEHLRNILGQLGVADISRQVLFSLFYDFDKDKNFKPLDIQIKPFEDLVKTVDLWAKAFKTIR